MKLLLCALIALSYEAYAAPVNTPAKTTCRALALSGGGDKVPARVLVRVLVPPLLSYCLFCVMSGVACSRGRRA